MPPVLLSSEGRFPGKFEPSPSIPSLDGLNSRAFLRKCLSWQQLRPTRTDSSPPALPSGAGGEGAEREQRERRDLARGQPRFAVKVARP